jgi:hypothetical protein
MNRLHCLFESSEFLSTASFQNQKVLSFEDLTAGPVKIHQFEAIKHGNITLPLPLFRQDKSRTMILIDPNNLIFFSSFVASHYLPEIPFKPADCSVTE